MKQDDTLWKGIIEDMPAHFCSLFFPNAEDVLDLERGFTFLDKELEQLFPEQEAEHPKFVDKLIKAYTKAGTEEWILIHIEVQGYYDKDFGKRMFKYFYRLLDKYDKAVTALAIFTDNNQAFKPNSYDYQFLGTSATFRFNTYKILDQDEEALKADNNPFAFVVLTTLMALKAKKWDDETLLAHKIDLFRRLYSCQMDKKTMQALTIFLKLYVHFSKPETNLTFETAIETITENQPSMGIVELVINREKQKSKAEGKAEGKAEVVANLISRLGLSDEQAAEIAGVPVSFVAEIRKNLGK